MNLYIALVVGALSIGLVYVFMSDYSLKNKKNDIQKIIECDVKNHLYNTKVTKKNIPLAIPSFIQLALKRREKGKQIRSSRGNSECDPDIIFSSRRIK